MDDLIGRTLKRYEIVSLLGEGGMGSVFKARDITLQRDVAIKVMHPQFARQPNFRERFLQEARTAARLDHPGIVQVHDFGQEGALLFIVMEFIPGANLRHMLVELRQAGKAIVLNEAVQLVRQVALALDYAHRQGVLHRDIKPSNIMLEPEPADGLPYRPVLTDLGLAKLLSGQAITQEGTSMGTPTYMSPEQALGQATDARSDVYSLGVLLFELSVGQPPFPAKTLTEAIRYHTKEPPPRPRSLKQELPESLERAILKSLEKQPENRFPDAGALAQALAQITPSVTQVSADPTALEEAVSLVTEYQKSLAEPRGPSILKEFDTPSDLSQDRIQVLPPDQNSYSAPIKPSGMTIGRDRDTDLPLQDSKASRKHARLEFDGQQYRITDLNSTNGTYLGNTKLLPGMPEVWTPDKPLRIGDSWLRLVITEGKGMRPSAVTGMVRSDGTRIESSQIQSSSGEGRVGMFMEEGQLSVEPGKSASTSIILLNQGNLVDHFSASLEGVPASWVAIDPPTVQMMPGEQKEMRITIRPPRISNSRAGRYPITVRVASQDAPDEAAEIKATLTLGAFSQFNTVLHPQKIRTGQAARLTVNNQGNVQETFNLNLQDRGEELVFTPPSARVRVPEGRSSAVEFRARPRQRRLIGRERTHPFTASVSVPQGETQSQSGELVSRALLPPWVIPAVIILCLVSAAAAVYWINNRNQRIIAQNATAIAQATQQFQNLQATSQAQTATAEFFIGANQATLAAATATAQWLVADDDVDGLSNAQEIEIGTLPGVRDTDADGLDDSEEFNTRGTDPLDSDSDDDGLKDGDEVGRGLNPLSNDTDEDGVLDNVDPDPLNTPTPTPDVNATAQAAAETAATQTAIASATQAAASQAAASQAAATQTAAASQTAIASTAQAAATLTAQAPVSIEFDTYPNGTAILSDVILNGDEFLSDGILLAGAPETPYCSDATAAAIRRPGTYSGTSFYFLTTARPGAINECNGIPVQIEFSVPVRRITLIFTGASVTYTLKAYNPGDSLIGTVDKESILGTESEVTFSSPSANIKRVTFGYQTAITAIKRITYEK